MLASSDPDIIVFTETWLMAGQSAPSIVGYTAFTFSRPTQHQRRAQGGIAVYVRDALAGRVGEWHVCPQACFAILRVPGVLPSGRDLMLVACYIPPANSPHYDAGVWQRLEERLGDAFAVGDPLIVGDLNARTGDRPDFPPDAATASSFAGGVHFEGVVPVSSVRRSQDARSSVNASGRRLLTLCMRLGLRIANGRVPGDEHGALTFVGRGGGTSLIDYVLSSPNIMPLIQELHVRAAPESDHLAVHLRLRSLTAVPPPRDPPPAPPPRMMGDDRVLQWAEVLSSQRCSDTLAEVLAIARTTSDRQSLLTVCAKFDALISETWAGTGRDSAAAGRAARQPCHRSREQSAQWFSPELSRMRAEATRAMHRCSRSEEAVHARRVYQRCLRRTRRAFIRRRSVALATQFRGEPRKFWSCFSSRGSAPPPIGVEQMTAHFRQLFGQASPVTAAGAGDVPSPALQHRTADGNVLSRHITAAEVVDGIFRLQRCKASVGLLSLDALRAAAPTLAGCIAALFNACVRAGTLPPDWALCRITPIHKGGDAMVAGNYRGIAVSTVLAKLYATLLTVRLSEWSERHRLRAVGQAGFRAGHSPADQMLVLRTMIESARADREPLFACFVDFQKAYDSVPRALLWRKLQSLGVTGWYLQAVQALYADVPLVVQGAPLDTLPFHSLLGVKQGCPLSPLLFGIYVDDLELTFAGSGLDIQAPALGGQPVPPLFYADDLALLARSQAGLQSQMDLLKVYSEKWQLTVNVAKTRAMVFRRAGSAAVQLHLVHRGSEVEVVDSFCYLGVVFHCTAPFSDAGVVRAATGHRAALAMARRCRELGIQDPVMRLQLFDALVRPVMLYGVEVWGPHSLGQLDAHFEREHRSFLRRLLGVRESTPSAVVLAELGRYPLAVLATVHVCKYWNRLMAMEDSRLVRLAFLESVRLATLPTRFAVRASWAAQVASLLAVTPLLATGPRHIDIKAALSALQRRYLTSVQESELPKVQTYLGHIAAPLRIGCYSVAAYLREVTSRVQLRHLAQLRTGSHRLRVETGRWERPRLERQERLCLRCLAGEVDDE